MIAPQPMFKVRAELADILQFGKTPYGERRVINILGGRVEGDRLGRDQDGRFRRGSGTRTAARFSSAGFR